MRNAIIQLFDTYPNEALSVHQIASYLYPKNVSKYYDNVLKTCYRLSSSRQNSVLVSLGSSPEKTHAVNTFFAKAQTYCKDNTNARS